MTHVVKMVTMNAAVCPSCPGEARAAPVVRAQGYCAGAGALPTVHPQLAHRRRLPALGAQARPHGHRRHLARNHVASREASSASNELLKMTDSLHCPPTTACALHFSDRAWREAGARLRVFSCSHTLIFSHSRFLIFSFCVTWRGAGACCRGRAQGVRTGIPAARSHRPPP